MRCRDRLGKIMLAIAALGITAQTPPNAGPRVNDIFQGRDGIRVAGWDYQGGALWGPSPERCCVAIFSRRDELMLVLTDRTDAKDDSERVRLTYRVPRLRSGVVLPDCMIDGRSMLLAVLDRKSGIVTGYESDGKSFTTITRKMDELGQACDWSDYEG